MNHKIIKSLCKHISWSEYDNDNNLNKIDQQLSQLQSQMKLKNENYPNIDFQHDIIPVIKKSEIKNLKKEMYDLFFKERGALILKNVFQKNQMDLINEWSTNMLFESKKDLNSTHKKQKDKFLINDVMFRMANTNPDLLMKTVFDPTLNSWIVL